MRSSERNQIAQKCFNIQIVSTNDFSMTAITMQPMLCNNSSITISTPTTYIDTSTKPDHSTMYNVLCIMYYVQCTMYNVLCIMYYVRTYTTAIHSTIYIQSAMYVRVPTP